MNAIIKSASCIICTLLLAATTSTVVQAIQYPIASGPCMNEAWLTGNASNTNELGCTANEITTTVTSVDGPSSCKEGDFIYVNVTTSMLFRATRYDFAVYTAVEVGGDPLYGESCAVDVLGVDDVTSGPGNEGVADQDGDSCYDVTVSGQGFTLNDFAFQENLKIPCLGDVEGVDGLKEVFLQTCYAWRNNGQNEICDVDGAYPGSVSKCDCASLPLGITIIGPSAAPSISALPTLMPSSNPSVSTMPTNSPSFQPSFSTQPTATPSQNPSVSSQPSGQPSQNPSLSTHPTTKPSLAPSSSSKPTTVPSLSPSISIKPTLADTLAPSISTSPSESPTVQPSTSSSPTDNPSDLPTTSTAPSFHPTSTPSASPSSSPTLLGSISGTIFEDNNVNGLMDGNDVILPNIPVFLYDDKANVVQETTSDSSGHYQFDDVFPGTEHYVLIESGSQYSISPVVIVGGNQMTPVGTDMGTSQSITISEGDLKDDVHGGVYQEATITGVVWHDLNANGIREEGEEAIEGAVVFVYNDNVEYMSFTDSTGNYEVTTLMPGTYNAKMNPPSPNFFFSPANMGSLEEIDSDFLPSTGVSSASVTLQSGSTSSGLFDAGFYAYASVGDFIWYDTNTDGIQNEDPIVGFPFPVIINLYDLSNGGQLLATTENDEYGKYEFNDLMPGEYEIEFIIEDTEIFGPPLRGNNDELDSNVNPDNGRAQFILVSAEMNTSVDVAIIGEAPYYPDWVFETQVCTNDGFDPTWMTTNDGDGIYLYRNKETCCANHFWWRTLQCMANEEYKFYRNGEICDTKVDFEDWELNSPADWTDTTLFDTKDECCANLFSYDYTGCMERSPVLFKFEFCVDIGGLLSPIDCQTADIYQQVIEAAINEGLGDASDAEVNRVGDTTLAEVDGSTECGGNLVGQDFINDLTGTTIDLSDVNQDSTTTVCGVITTESYDCTMDACLMDLHDSIVVGLTNYINSGGLTDTLQSMATARLPPTPELQVADVRAGTLYTFDLLLPTTMSAQLGDSKYAKDGEQCISKTAFASWEIPYDSLQLCCENNFAWDIDGCCTSGGGCGIVSEGTPAPNPSPPSTTSSTSATSTSTSSTVGSTTTSSTVGSTTTGSTSVTTTSATGTSTSSTAGSTTTGSTSVTTTTSTSSPQETVYFYATWNEGQLCDSKPSSQFEGWEAKFNSLDECCDEKFSYDKDACCAGNCASDLLPPPPLRYYATWTNGQLCDAKRKFEDWEESFETLEDCCIGKFRYDYEGCCQSNGMGGCV